MGKHPKVGDSVVFIDERRRKHNALVTADWSETCVNLLYVSSDEKKEDDYGRQIERDSSCVHKSLNDAGAHCWCWPDEV